MLNTVGSVVDDLSVSKIFISTHQCHDVILIGRIATKYNLRPDNVLGCFCVWFLLLYLVPFSVHLFVSQEPESSILDIWRYPKTRIRMIILAWVA